MSTHPHPDESSTNALLERLAKRYIWRWPVEESLRRRDHLVAQVMDIGTWNDVGELLRALGEDEFRRVLALAQPGWFSARSWAYWHYRLRVTDVDRDPPALPQRALPA